MSYNTRRQLVKAVGKFVGGLIVSFFSYKFRPRRFDAVDWLWGWGYNEPRIRFKVTTDKYDIRFTV
jgi:hypothetical protein